MKQLQELIKETLVTEDAKGEYPNFPYIYQEKAGLLKLQ